MGKRKRNPSVGKTFGRWTIVSLDEQFPDDNDKRRWLVKCECGKEKWILVAQLYKKRTTQCNDCRLKQWKIRLTKHGLSHDRIHNIWNRMKDRCYNPNSEVFSYYGGRNISICEEWKDNFQTFYNWCTDNGYNSDLEIDRINNNGNYEPLNCRFVTHKRNMYNRRGTNNSVSSYKGVSWHISSKKWRARITINKQEFNIGVFNTREDAALAYNEKAKELFGEYAYLNVIRQ